MRARASVVPPAVAVPAGAPQQPPGMLYGQRAWALAVAAARRLPAGWLRRATLILVRLYRRLDRRRRRVVERNLAPLLGRAAPDRATELFDEFALKLADLWRFEAGRFPADEFRELLGRDHLTAALAGNRGVLLVTIHLGNWELGATVLARFGRRLLVLTRPEPSSRFTEQRRAHRAALGIDTLVVGDAPFAVLDVIRHLNEAGLVALLVDRPEPSTAVPAEFLGQPILVSRAPAELARATGCLVLPVTIVRGNSGYRAEVLPPMDYDRRALNTAEARARFAGEILRAFEPAVRQHPTQWFHFVDVWNTEAAPPTPRT